MKVFCTVLVACFFVVAKAQVTCNALDLPSLLEPDVTYSSITEDDFTVIEPAVLSGGVVTLVAPDEDDGTGGVSSTFWHTEKRRISDGFKASFDFEYSGNSDGLAFVIQNDKIVDIEGNGGASLGYLNGLDKYFAVGFDMCPKLSRPTRYPCDPSSAVLVSASGQGVFPAAPVIFDSVEVPRSLFPQNTTITADVYYLSNTKEIVVFVGSSELIRVDISGDFTTVEEHFGGRFGYFGFTASNGVSDAGTFKVMSMELNKFISEVRVSSSDAGSFPREVDLGKQTVIDVVVVDSCNEPSSAIQNALNITADRITATLTNNGTNGITVLDEPIIDDRGTGEIGVVFQMPSNILGDWTFYASIEVASGTVLLQNIPIEAAITTVNPIEALLPLWGLVLLITLLSLMLLITAYYVKRLYRYRQKLKEAEEDILFGKEKVLVDRLDEDVTYTMNPLMGTLDEMEEKLKRNQETLAALRRGEKPEGEDIDHTIQQLKQANEDLRKEMKELKIKEQMEEVTATPGKRKFRFKREKQEFDQEKAV